MDGIFLINKEVDWTSRDVVNYISHRFQTKKVGHVGTLDPFATGLLIVLIGKATKIAPYLENQEKKYRATLTLGADTDTLDLKGKVVRSYAVPNLDEAKIKSVLQSFIGEIEQEVPKYSAVKWKGQELYKYARQEQFVPTIKRTITIKEIHLISFDDHNITFEVICSKGTYIRQLGQDIAHRLQTGGYLSSLERIAIGKFSVEEATRVKNVQKEQLFSIKEGLSHLPIIMVDDAQARDIRNGRPIAYESDEPLLFAIDREESPLAILAKNDKVYLVKRGLF